MTRRQKQEPPHPQKEEEDQDGLTQGQKYEGRWEVPQVASVQLQPEQEADPPQPHSQQGEELLQGVMGEEAKEPRPQYEAEEEEVGTGPEHQKRPGRHLQPGKGEPGSE